MYLVRQSVNYSTAFNPYDALIDRLVDVMLALTSLYLDSSTDTVTHFLSLLESSNSYFIRYYSYTLSMKIIMSSLHPLTSTSHNRWEETREGKDTTHSHISSNDLRTCHLYLSCAAPGAL